MRRAAPGRNAGAKSLFDAITNPVPSAGLPIRAAAVPSRGIANRARVDVFIEISGSGIAFEQTGGTFNNVLSWSIGVYDKSGKTSVATPEVSTIELALKPDMHARVRQSGVRVWRRLDVPEGRTYQVRVAARESGGGSSGSVSIDLDIPEFSTDVLAMSGLALASSADASMVAFKNPLSGTLPAAPTLLRVFPSGGELAATVEISTGGAARRSPIEIITNVQGSDGRTVFSTREPRSSAEGGRAAAYGVRIPTRSWAPGIYVLTIAASAGGAEPVSRQIQITLR
jgi:hypothetical protein